MHGEILWNFLSWKSINFSLLRSPSIVYQAVSTKYVITFSPLYPLPGATKARDHLLKLQWNTEIIQEKDWIWRRFGSSILVNFDLLIKSTSTLWTLCYTSISLKTLMIHSNISPNVTTQPKPAISSSVCSQNKLLSIWPVSNGLSFLRLPSGLIGLASTLSSRWREPIQSRMISHHTMFWPRNELMSYNWLN